VCKNCFYQHHLLLTSIRIDNDHSIEPLLQILRYSLFIYYAIALSDTNVMRILKVNLIVLLLIYGNLAFGISKVTYGGA
jgi:hypothetical protein